MNRLSPSRRLHNNLCINKRRQRAKAAPREDGKRGGATGSGKGRRGGGGHVDLAARGSSACSTLTRPPASSGMTSGGGGGATERTASLPPKKSNISRSSEVRLQPLSRRPPRPRFSSGTPSCCTSARTRWPRTRACTTTTAAARTGKGLPLRLVRLIIDILTQYS